MIFPFTAARLAEWADKMGEAVNGGAVSAVHLDC